MWICLQKVLCGCSLLVVCGLAARIVLESSILTCYRSHIQPPSFCNDCFTYYPIKKSLPALSSFDKCEILIRKHSRCNKILTIDFCKFVAECAINRSLWKSINILWKVLKKSSYKVLRCASLLFNLFLLFFSHYASICTFRFIRLSACCVIKYVGLW